MSLLGIYIMDDINLLFTDHLIKDKLDYLFPDVFPKSFKGFNLSKQTFHSFFKSMQGFMLILRISQID